MPVLPAILIEPSPSWLWRKAPGAAVYASEMAREVPTVMIFSSSIAGLSHTKEENTPDAHLEMAADAFNRTCRSVIELIAAGELG